MTTDDQNLKLDVDSGEVVVHGGRVALSPFEFDLLQLLYTRRGRVTTHLQIVESVWKGTSVVDFKRNIEQLVYDLRAKIESNPRRPVLVQTIRGIGYRLNVRSAQPCRVSLSIPISPTPLVGRRTELARIKDLLREETIRMITILGPPGVGKTRLALQLVLDMADDFADGGYFVNLEAVRDSALFIPTIVEALGVREVAGDAPLNNTMRFLRQRQILMVLDNVEQLTNQALLVTQLLAASPELKVIVTSREPLHVRGEHQFVITPLAYPHPTDSATPVDISRHPAVTLFLQRAQAVNSTFALTSEICPTIVELCARLNGLPLAIEIVASYCKFLSPQSLLRHLNDHLLLLKNQAQDSPVRHQTLRVAIDWSYNLLDLNEQRLFRDLALFTGGFTVDAVEQVCSIARDRSEAIHTIPDELAMLVDKSLVYQAEASAGQRRFWQLGVIQKRALELLAATGGTAELKHRHAAYYLSLAERETMALLGRSQVSALEHLEQEHGNMSAALLWAVANGEIEMSLRFGVALSRYWLLRGLHSEGGNLLSKILSLADEVGEFLMLKTQVLIGAGRLACAKNDLINAHFLYNSSLTYALELTSEHLTAESLCGLGDIAFSKSEIVAARDLYEQSMDLIEHSNHQETIANVQLGLANIAYVSGDYKVAQMRYEAALAKRREMGDMWGIADILASQGRLTSDEFSYGARPVTRR